MSGWAFNYDIGVMFQGRGYVLRLGARTGREFAGGVRFQGVGFRAPGSELELTVQRCGCSPRLILKPQWQWG